MLADEMLATALPLAALFLRHCYASKMLRYSTYLAPSYNDTLQDAAPEGTSPACTMEMLSATDIPSLKRPSRLLSSFIAFIFKIYLTTIIPHLLKYIQYAV